MTLEGKTAVITGGTGALGRVVAERLADEGARVFLAARKPAPKTAFAEGSASRMRFIRTDVTRESSVDALFRAVGKTGRRADILVHCAGAFAYTGPLSGTGVRDWDRMMEINLRSTFLCCRAFLRGRAAARFGRIVNIAAQTVFRPSTGRIPYAVAKGGVATLTELLGEELRGTGITANAIAPSVIRTRENIKAMPDEDPSKWVAPEDIAEEIVRLCSPSAAAINGAIIPMFGGVKA